MVKTSRASKKIEPRYRTGSAVRLTTRVVKMATKVTRGKVTDPGIGRPIRKCLNGYVIKWPLVLWKMGDERWEGDEMLIDVTFGSTRLSALIAF